MIALEPPRPYRDSDALFDLGSASLTRRRGGDIRMELNMSVHLEKASPPDVAAAGPSGRPAPEPRLEHDQSLVYVLRSTSRPSQPRLSSPTSKRAVLRGMRHIG